MLNTLNNVLYHFLLYNIISLECVLYNTNNITLISYKIKVIIPIEPESKHPLTLNKA